MIKSFVAAIALLIASSASATSLDPCTPTREAAPYWMACAKDGLRYHITFKTLMSQPIPECMGENHVEYETAYIEVSDSEGKSVGTITVNDGRFESSLREGTFDSPALSIHLKGCVHPLHGGGVSIGN